ncbi:hypothetical protein V8G54_002109 [Vigna mungo]|uniref:Uncharacterized protein n=1 Tax=Vigna mungo TaxID=3915 RepID=A0AAQ3P880_VIGMU
MSRSGGGSSVGNVASPLGLGVSMEIINENRVDPLEEHAKSEWNRRYGIYIFEHGVSEDIVSLRRACAIDYVYHGKENYEVHNGCSSASQCGPNTTAPYCMREPVARVSLIRKQKDPLFGLIGNDLTPAMTERRRDKGMTMARQRRGEGTTMVVRLLHGGGAMKASVLGWMILVPCSTGFDSQRNPPPPLLKLQLGVSNSHIFGFWLTVVMQVCGQWVSRWLQQGWMWLIPNLDPIGIKQSCVS